MAFSRLTCLVVIFMSTLKIVSSSHEDACDWINSGEAPSSGHGVQSLYLRCSKGRISWRWPSGALRVVLRLGTSGKNFRGCLRVDSEARQTGRIYLEGERRLHLLLARDDGRPKELHRCFSSKRGQVGLYVEADSDSYRYPQSRIDFAYQLQPRSSRDVSDLASECRPCSNAELLRHYCTSDFVVEATVSRINHDERLQMTRVYLQISRVLRRSYSFPVERVVYVPLKCASRRDVGQFVIFATRFLNRPMLRCAPRLEEWTRLRKEAIRTNAHQCVL